VVSELSEVCYQGEDVERGLDLGRKGKDLGIDAFAIATAIWTIRTFSRIDQIQPILKRS
jgi:hypothetical protein